MFTSRGFAYQILLNMEGKAVLPDRLIRSTLQRHSRMDERDRALMTELVYGVLRWQGRLDWHIDALSRVNPSKIAPAVRILLRLALYQVLMLTRIPAHAAVNETVKIAGSTQPPHVVRFVNGMLREAIRRGDKWDWPPRDTRPAEYLAVTTSHPLWFVRKCLQEIGFDETEGLCGANNVVAPMVLRVNRLKAEREAVMEGLREAGLEPEVSPYLPDAVRLSSVRRDLSRLPLYAEGWVQIQDEASQLIGHLLTPAPGERVLDLCSGFGGKATHMAVLMENRGRILSVDNSAWKLEELRANARRQGVGVVEGGSLDGEGQGLAGTEGSGSDRQPEASAKAEGLVETLRTNAEAQDEDIHNAEAQDEDFQSEDIIEGATRTSAEEQGQIPVEAANRASSKGRAEGSVNENAAYGSAEGQGAGMIATLAADILELQPETIGTFDRVLLDAPCSGFGSVRRNPDIKWRRHPKDPYRFGQMQRDLLKHAAEFVRPGGVLVYATCTHFPEEDEMVAEHFTETHPDFVIEPADGFLPESCRSMTEGPWFKSWPHRHGVDGFFGARWRRKG